MSLKKPSRTDHLDYRVCRTGGSVANFNKTLKKTTKISEEGILDYTTRYGAMRLARAIEQYWRDRGFFDVEASASKVTHDAFGKSLNHSQLYSVRTNLVNGCPPSIMDAVAELAEIKKASNRYQQGVFESC